MMEQAGWKGHLPTFVLGTIGITIAFGMGILTLTNYWPAAILASVIGGAIPYVIARYRRNKRMYAFEEMLPEAIDLLGRAIRAGHPLSAGLKMVADETTEPIQGEFRRTHEENRFGLPFEDALLAMADRVNIVDVRILVTAILIQREVGGNLAEVLQTTVDTMRERSRLRRHVRALSAEGRLSAWVLIALPLGLGLFMFVFRRGYMTPLVTDPTGITMLVGGSLLFVLGIVWLLRVIKVEA